MPNKNTHVVVGAAAGAAFSLFVSKGQKDENRLLELIGGCIGGGLGGRSADLMEPASHPGHRQFAHSAVAGTISAVNAPAIASGLAEFFRDMADNVADYRKQHCTADFDKNLNVIVEITLRILAGVGPGIIAGYISHLALDAMTKKSLPLL